MSTFDLSNLSDLLECQVKLRGSLDERLVITWIRATQYAVVDTLLTPLYNLMNASFQKFKRIDDNGYAHYDAGTGVLHGPAQRRTTQSVH